MILNYLEYIVLTKPHTAVSASSVQASSALCVTRFTSWSPQRNYYLPVGTSARVQSDIRLPLKFKLRVIQPRVVLSSASQPSAITLLAIRIPPSLFWQSQPSFSTFQSLPSLFSFALWSNLWLQGRLGVCKVHIQGAWRQSDQLSERLCDITQ